MVFYFSGCGNSEHVAETLAAGLNDNLVFIPEAAREGRYKYELADGESLGFVFPIYAWGPPKLVMDFVEKMTVKVGPSTLRQAQGPCLMSILPAPAAMNVVLWRTSSARLWNRRDGSCMPASVCRCLRPLLACPVSSLTQMRTPNERYSLQMLSWLSISRECKTRSAFRK